MNRDYYLTMPDFVRSFLNYQSTIRNKSDGTIDEYCLDLRMFLRFVFCIRSGLPVNDPEAFDSIDITGLKPDFVRMVTLDEAYQFLSFCKDARGNHERARARKVSCIRAFFKYLKMNGVIDDNPMVNLDSPKLKKTQPKYLTEEQARALLRSVSGPNRARDYCIITFLLNCGMRLSELVSLDYNKINLTDEGGTVVITGKGNKERTVYLNRACVAAFNAYMAVRPKDGVKDKNALFLSNRGTRINPKTVQYLVQQYLEKSGLGDQGYSVHKLRHTAATLMYQSGQVDLLELQALLGHENLNTTQIYTHLNVKKLQDAVDANPLAEFDLSGKPNAQAVPDENEASEQSAE